MSSVHSPFESAHRILEDLRPYTTQYLPEKGDIATDLQERLKRDGIHIMLFGTYNAGKSTLINALLGREEAKVNDVPTTFKVDRYNWCGHTLLDTPGVNAPIDHEEVAMEELQKTDLVLFVIRSGDQDARDVYERLFALVADNRPVFVLLNDTTSSPQEANDQIDRLNQLLLLIGHEEKRFSTERINSIPVMKIRARSAFIGRLNDKPAMCAASGYDDFIERFNLWLASFADGRKRLDLARETIEKQVLKPLDDVLGDMVSANGPLETMTAELQRCRQECTNLKTRARGWVRAEVGLARHQIGSMLDENNVDTALPRMGDDIARKLETWLRQECADIETLSSKLDPVTIATDGTDTFHTGKMLEDVAIKAAQGVGKDGIKATLMAGRSLGLPFLKGRWASTLDKWAGRAVPALQAVIGIWQVASAVREERERNRQLLAAAMRRHQVMEEIASGLESTFSEAATSAIEAWSARQCAPMEQELNALKDKAGAANRHRAEIHQHRARLNALSCDG